MPGHRIFATAFADVHPFHVAEVEGRGRTRAEVDDDGLAAALDQRVTFEGFFARAPAMSPHADLITGSVCGVRVEQVEDPLARKIRMRDELVDEIAKGRPMSKVLRSPALAWPPPEPCSSAGAGPDAAALGRLGSGGQAQVRFRGRTRHSACPPELAWPRASVRRGGGC